MRNKKLLYSVTILIGLALLSGTFLIKYLENNRNRKFVEEVNAIEIYDIKVIKIAKLVNWKPEDCLVINKRNEIEAFMKVLRQIEPVAVKVGGSVSIERIISINADYGTHTYLLTIFSDFPEKIIITPDIYKVKRHSNYNLNLSGKEAALIKQSEWYLDLLKSSNCLD